MDDGEDRKLSLTARINKILSTTQGRTYTTVAATILIVVLMAVFAIIPAYISITDQVAANQAKTEYIAKLIEKEQAITSLVKQRDRYTEAIKLLDLFLGEKVNNEYMIANVNKIAEDHNCTVTTFSFDKPQTSKNIKTLPMMVSSVGMSFTVNCKIEDIKGFYQQINDFPTPIYIITVNYTNKTDSKSLIAFGDSINSRFNIQIATEYYFWNVPSTTIKAT